MSLKTALTAAVLLIGASFVPAQAATVVGNTALAGAGVYDTAPTFTVIYPDFTVPEGVLTSWSVFVQQAGLDSTLYMLSQVGSGDPKTETTTWNIEGELTGTATTTGWNVFAASLPVEAGWALGLEVNNRVLFSYEGSNLLLTDYGTFQTDFDPNTFQVGSGLGDRTYLVNATITPVPLPAGVSFGLAGLACLGAARLLRRKRALAGV